MRGGSPYYYLRRSPFSMLLMRARRRRFGEPGDDAISPFIGTIIAELLPT